MALLELSFCVSSYRRMWPHFLHIRHEPVQGFPPWEYAEGFLPPYSSFELGWLWFYLLIRVKLPFHKQTKELTTMKQFFLSLAIAVAGLAAFFGLAFAVIAALVGTANHVTGGPPAPAWPYIVIVGAAVAVAINLVLLHLREEAERKAKQPRGDEL